MGTPSKELAQLQAENDQLNAEVAQLNEQLLALETARDRYADLYDFVSVACLTLDANGAITEANRRTVSLVRYDRQRLVGTPLMTLVIREHRRRFLEHLAICRRGVDAVTFDITLAPSEGKPIPVRITIRSNRELGGYALAMVDMRAIENAQAEQQRLALAEREAQVENQVKSRLIANLSIELRGLLGAVLRAGSEVSDRADLAHEIRAPLSQLLQVVSSLQQRVIRLSSARIRAPEGARQAPRLGRAKVRRVRAMK